MVLGPNSPSSRQRATVVLAALGDPRVVGSEIRGEMCRNMESQRDECRLRGDGGRGDEACVRAKVTLTCQCEASAGPHLTGGQELLGGVLVKIARNVWGLQVRRRHTNGDDKLTAYSVFMG